VIQIAYGPISGILAAIMNIYRAGGASAQVGRSPLKTVACAENAPTTGVTLETVLDYFDSLWGSGSDLNVLQMTVRSAATFLITVLLIRIGGRRAFGQRNAFDVCVAVLLGSVLSRAVVGASPFPATVAACFVIVALHRAVAHLSMHSAWFDRIVNGEIRALFVDGSKNQASMTAGLIKNHELDEALRKHTQSEDYSKVSRMLLEQSGEITVVLIKD